MAVAGAALRLGNAHPRHSYQHYWQPQHDHNGYAALQTVFYTLPADLSPPCVVQLRPSGLADATFLAWRSRESSHPRTSPLCAGPGVYAASPTPALRAAAQPVLARSSSAGIGPGPETSGSPARARSGIACARSAGTPASCAHVHCPDL